MKAFIVFLVSMAFLPAALFSQAENEPYKVVFKVKKEHATKCAKDAIELPEIKQILKQKNQQTAKVFPNHRREKAAHLVDLSTLYEIQHDDANILKQLASELKRSQAIEYAELLYPAQMAYTPSDSENTKQWYLQAIDAFNAWGIEQGDTNVVVGIVDTGFDIDHPDLVDAIAYNHDDPINGIDDDQDGYIDNYYGWNVANRNNNIDISFFGHGTNVAGIASAATDNITGISGVGFNTKMLLVKGEDENSGRLRNVYEGMVYAADQGAFIINNSWGSFFYSQFAQDIVNYCALNKGALVIAAIGNNGADTLFYPAAYENVLSVGSLLPGDTLKESSNYGYYVDLYAPGEDMWTCNAIGGYQYNGGTSMAAPVVAGVASLVKSRFPNYTAEQISILLKNTADDLENINAAEYQDKLGSGKVNAFRALSEDPIGIVFENLLINDKNDGVFINGDTLNISGRFKNYLANATGVTISLEVSGNHLNPIKTSYNIGSLNTNDTVNNYNTPFQFKVPSQLSSQKRIDFLMRIQTDQGNFKQHFSTTLNPDFIILKENQLELTLTSDGSLGYSGRINNLGNGYQYLEGSSLLYGGSFAIGINPQEVADHFWVDTSRLFIEDFDDDFTKENLIAIENPSQSKAEVSTTFSYPMQAGGKLSVKQTTYLFDSDSLSSTIIHHYQIKNEGTANLQDAYAGILADWDIIDRNRNKITYDSSRKMGISFSTDSNLFCGIRALAKEYPVKHYAIDNTPSGEGGLNLSTIFNDSLKFEALSSMRDSAGNSRVEGNDVIDVISYGPFDLNADSSISLSFSISFAKDFNQLLEYSDSAQAAFNQLTLGQLEQLAAGNMLASSLFPNPASQNIHFRFQSLESERATISIFNSSGQLVYELGEQQFNKGSQELIIDVSSWKTGVYFLLLNGDKLKIQNKFVVSP